MAKRKITIRFQGADLISESAIRRLENEKGHVRALLAVLLGERPVNFTKPIEQTAHFMNAETRRIIEGLADGATIVVTRETQHKIFGRNHQPTANPSVSLAEQGLHADLAADMLAARAELPEQYRSMPGLLDVLLAECDVRYARNLEEKPLDNGAARKTLIDLRAPSERELGSLIYSLMERHSERFSQWTPSTKQTRKGWVKYKTHCQVDVDGQAKDSMLQSVGAPAISNIHDGIIVIAIPFETESDRNRAEWLVGKLASGPTVCSFLQHGIAWVEDVPSSIFDLAQLD